MKASRFHAALEDPDTTNAFPPTAQGARDCIWKWFVRLVVVAFGLLIGGVIAIVIGFVSGLIEINC